jgi:hypothetical protein
VADSFAFLPPRKQGWYKQKEENKFTVTTLNPTGKSQETLEKRRPEK